MRKVNLGNAGKTLSAVIAVLFAFCLAFMSVFYVRAYAEESLQLVSASGTYYREEPQDLEVRAQAQAITGISGCGIEASDYEIADGVLTIKKEFLNELGGTNAFTVTAAEGSATYTVQIENGKYNVYGWELASSNNLSFYQEGDWLRLHENAQSNSADTIDVMFNRNGFDISLPIEMDLKFNSVPDDQDYWLGFFLCKDLTTTQQDMNIPGKTTLDIDVQGRAADPWMRARIGNAVVGPGQYLGGVNEDGSFTMRIEVMDERTDVTFTGGGKEVVYSIPERTSSYFTEGKLYFNARLHNGVSGSLLDMSLSEVRNGIPVHYVSDEGTETVRVAEDTQTIVLAEAPSMADGKQFGAWRDSEGNFYQPGDTYTLTGETTFTAVPSASAAVVSLEYDTVVWSGEEKKPSVTVTLGDVTIDSSNYDVVYADNINVGTGKVTVTFKNEYYGSATATFTITKIQENKTEEDVSLTLEEATLDKMKVLDGNYVYTIKDAAGNEVTAQTQIAAGLYIVTAVLDTETKTTTVTYRVAVGKTLEDAEGEDISLTFEEATYAKMTALGSDYVYTVTDSQGNTVTEGTALAAGVYTVKAVKETATQIRTVTYTVTIAPPVEVEDPSDDPTPPPEDPDKNPDENQGENPGEEQGNGCSSSVGGGALAVFAVPALAVCAVLIARRKNSIRK